MTKNRHHFSCASQLSFTAVALSFPSSTPILLHLSRFPHQFLHDAAPESKQGIIPIQVRKKQQTCVEGSGFRSAHGENARSPTTAGRHC